MSRELYYSHRKTFPYQGMDHLFLLNFCSMERGAVSATTSSCFTCASVRVCWFASFSNAASERGSVFVLFSSNFILIFTFERLQEKWLRRHTNIVFQYFLCTHINHRIQSLLSVLTPSIFSSKKLYATEKVLPKTSILCLLQKIL